MPVDNRLGGAEQQHLALNRSALAIAEGVVAAIERPRAGIA
jgi:hypothetical protein